MRLNTSMALLPVLFLVSCVQALNYNISLNSQVRSAFHGANGMTISWNTFQQLSSPTVMYGLSASSLTMQASSNISVTYNTSLTYNNHVQLSDLFPNTKYYFLPTQMINQTTTPYTFNTSRPLGDSTPYAAAVVVDMGAMGSEGLGTTAGSGIPADDILQPGEQNTIQSLTSEGSTYDFLLQPGDLAYADTWLTETNQGYINGIATYAEGYKAYESILDTFYDQMVSITGVKAFMVGPGNHEANCVDGYSNLCMPGQSNFTGFFNHFRMPSDVASQAPNNPGFANMWYSFDHGMTHYISLDAETDIPNPPTTFAGPFAPSGAQVAWLAADLAAVNRTITPWIVVALHRPWYTSGGTCPACRAAFEPLLNQYDVDLVITGHYHVYERNTPIGIGGVIDPAGLDNPTSPWYILNGVGGHYGGLNPFNYYSKYQEYGLSILNSTYGWSRLTFHNCTHLTHEFVNSSSNAVLDTATLYKARNCSLVNNYVLPGYAASKSDPSLKLLPLGFLGVETFPGNWNPSQCAQRCNAIWGCNFFLVFKPTSKPAEFGCSYYVSESVYDFFVKYFPLDWFISITDANTYAKQ